MSRIDRNICAWLLALAMPTAHAQQVINKEWLIDSARSSALFEVHLRLGIDSKATSKTISGHVKWLSAEQWQVRLVMPVEPLKFSGPAWMDRAAKSKEFLYSKQYPEIVFESAAQPKTLLMGGGILRGKLHMRGQIQDVQVQLKSERCEQGAGQCLLNVTGTVSRKRFGMSASRWTVKDNIDLEFNIHFLPPP